MKKLVLLLFFVMECLYSCMACTSAVILGSATVSGRPLLWKHRDTGHELNFVERVSADADAMGYVALFNGGDSLLSEAWIGVNDAGFAIMNTASYNLAPDSAKIKDREGLVMTLALKQCKSVVDFEHMLAAMPKPLGVQANFGVIDAYGNGAFFETDDYSWVKYDARDTPDGVLIRTNFSYSGKYGTGLGWVRYINACCVMHPYIDNRSIDPSVLMDSLSCSFYHSVTNRDVLKSDISQIADVDFIPRHITSASVVIEGVVDQDSVPDCVMWVKPGYPPCSSVHEVTLDSVPESLRPLSPGYNSPEWIRMSQIRNQMFHKKSDMYYVDLDNVRKIRNVKFGETF